MSVYCIIVTYNAMKWVERCLSSLHTSSIPVVPVVVDNQSSDETVDFITSHYPEVIVLPQDKNLGFGQANNIGIIHALRQGASHLLLLNQDAAISSDTIDKLLACDDGKHLLTPIHLNGDGEHIDANFYSKTIIGSCDSHTLIEDLLIHKNLQAFYPVRYVNAACWLLPKAVITTVGGFNPLFFQYGEDDNYINRLNYYHFGARMVIDAFIFHDREKHGNEDIYLRGALYRQLLINRTNINLTHKERIFMHHKICLQELGRSLQKHYFTLCTREVISATHKLLWQSKVIRQSRYIETNINNAWLNL